MIRIACRLFASLLLLAPAFAVSAQSRGGLEIDIVGGNAAALPIAVVPFGGATRLAFARSFDLSIYLYAALIYLALTEIIRRVWDRIEVRLTRHMALR